MSQISQPSGLGWAQARWGGLSLARQFTLAGAAVLIVGMATIGFWVTQQIAAGVTRNTATATALYVDSVIAPLLPDIGSAEALSEGVRRALDETLSEGALGQRLVSFKIWKSDGLIIYSSRPELVGRRFEPTENLRQAWTGKVVAEFDDLSDEEDQLERAEGLPLLEVYSPVREPWTGKVVAVVEFYEVAHELDENLRTAQLGSWLVVALVAAGMMALLAGIVARGSRMIDTQRVHLEGRVRELSRLAAQNDALRLRVQAASGRAVALNERFLKRVSADLHDGPAQLLALASLKLGDASLASTERAEELSHIRSHLNEAMAEIREICRGLTLPQIERLGLSEIVHAAVAAHRQRTGTAVETALPDTQPTLDVAEKICIFRFVQEGLNNAFRHAGGRGQAVRAESGGGVLRVTVSDTGPGLDAQHSDAAGLGLAGLRERVESLGGTFVVESASSGTRLVMTLQHAEELR